MSSTLIDLHHRKVGPIGYGLMSLTIALPGSPPPEEERVFACLQAALEANMNVWNGGEFYGTPEWNSLTLLHKFYDQFPEAADQVVLNIKGCTLPGHIPDSSAANTRRSVENCLRMLGPRGKIDMFEPARKDPKVPIEETMEELKKLKAEGKIGGVALSEVSAETIRKAAKIVTIDAVEVELSLWQREPLENGVVEVCGELGIPIHAYSPVGRGFLTGRFKTHDDIPAGFQRMLPRFSAENFDINVKISRAVEQLAAKKGCLPAQLAINWVSNLSKRKGYPVIIPIPGSSNVERVKQNSVVVDFTEEELEQIQNVLEQHEVKGTRYPEAFMGLLDG